MKSIFIQLEIKRDRNSEVDQESDLHELAAKRLEDAADKIRKRRNTHEGVLPLRDVNGNCVGSMSYHLDYDYDDDEEE
jgi:hypothetical protein